MDNSKSIKFNFNKVFLKATALVVIGVFLCNIGFSDFAWAKTDFYLRVTAKGEDYRKTSFLKEELVVRARLPEIVNRFKLKDKEKREIEKTLDSYLNLRGKGRDSNAAFIEALGQIRDRSLNIAFEQLVRGHEGGLGIGFGRKQDEKDVNLGKKKDKVSGKFRTFTEFSSTSLNKEFKRMDEQELFMMWPLYLFEVDRAFAEADDYQQAYSEFFNVYSRHLTKDKIKPSLVQAYVPIIRKPFSSLKEVKDMIGITFEWSIDFLPEPDKWKGASLYSFILCLMDDGQLHMSFYDWNGIMKEFNTDEEVKKALRTIGLIGDDGMLILTRSSMDKRLKDYAVPGIGIRISLGGHSHPQGSGVVPSQTGRIEAPADIELFSLRLTRLPEGYPINRDIPPFLERKLSDAAAEKDYVETAGESLDIPDKNLASELGKYIKMLEDFTGSQTEKKSQMPIDELVLYLRVLIAMYEDTVGKYKGTKEDSEYVHKDRAEFAGELAYHPKFQADARRMLQLSFEGAFRVLAEQFPGSFLESPSSLEEMMSIMTQLLEECSMHPELRESAIAIINDPRTYGLDEIDLIKTGFEKSLAGGESKKGQHPKKIKRLIETVTGRIRGEESLRAKAEVLPESKGIARKEFVPIDFAAISDALVASAEKGKSKLSNALKPRPEEVVRARSDRLLILTNACANDDPQIAEATLREYLRLLKKFGDKVNFYCAVTLDEYENIMANQNLRPILMEIARSIDDRNGKLNMLTKIATQLIKEEDMQGALDLLEEIGSATYSTFLVALEQLIDSLLLSEKRNKKMIQQLEHIIENISESKGMADERQVELFVRFGDKYYQLGMERRARSFYNKAWTISERVAEPAIMRLVHLLPLMREKGIRFSEGRADVLKEVTRMAENDLLKNYPDEKPDKMILLAREYAFNREYDKTEECAQFINDNMDFPRDHYDDCYGAIIEAAALHGDNDRIAYAASKMTNYVKDHFGRAAQLLIERGEYQKAMELGNQAMQQGYFGSPTVGYWGLTQLRIAKNILRQDNNQIAMVRSYLETAVSAGIESHDLGGIVDLLSEYPALDPDGQFMLNIFNIAFERNFSYVPHDSHRIILQNLRKIILAKVKELDPSLLGIKDVYKRVNRVLTSEVSETKDFVATVDDTEITRKYIASRDRLKETAKYPALTDEMAKKLSAKQSFILYAEQLLDNGGIIDAEDILRVFYNNDKLGKIFIFAENMGKAKVLENLIRGEDSKIETMTVTKETLKKELNLKHTISEVEEIKALIEFAKRNEVEPEDIFSIIKGRAKNLDSLKELSAQPGMPPILLFKPTGKNNLYSLASGFELIISGEKGIIFLAPLPITQNIEEEIEEYNNSLELYSAS